MAVHGILAQFFRLKILRNSLNLNLKDIGHIGLSEIGFNTSAIRIDSVMRGVKGNTPGIIKSSIVYLKDWCKKELGAYYC